MKISTMNSFFCICYGWVNRTFETVVISKKLAARTRYFVHFFGGGDAISRRRP